ncbi:MAG TPA: DUF5606 domain-containing protein [Bacteroidia bacterium]|nr:DUF5606 domain-containing protein [Bacteroidia bacterium]
MKRIDVDKIITVTGEPGLYKIITNGTKGVIVENIIDKKRTIILNNSKLFSLETVRIFTNDAEMFVSEALYRLYEVLNGQPAPHHKKSSDEEIKTLFEKAIPEYDRERVYINNMRKLIQWYNALHSANMLNVIEDENNKEVSENKNQPESVSIEKESTETATDTPAPKKRGRKKKTDSE